MNETGELEYTEIPYFVMTHPELQPVDVAIYVAIKSEQKKVGKPLTKWEQYENIRKYASTGRKRKMSMKALLKRIKKLEDLRIIKREDPEDIYLKLDSTTYNLSKK